MAIATTVSVVHIGNELSTVAGIIGTLISLIYFIQKQRLDELKLFRELFREFNERYDRINQDLENVMQGSSLEVTPNERDLLIDYFNLCGEEYFFYQKGYIDPIVWNAWLNGMRFIVSAPRIQAVWRLEQKTNSYYGLNI